MGMILQTRRFRKEDAKEVSRLIVRNLTEVNIRDYGMEEMKKLADGYGPDKVTKIADCAHMYVIEREKEIVGCGAVSSCCGSKTESMLLSIFVLPEYHGRGVGRTIMHTLEQDELYIRADRIEIAASITADGFYRKFGYDYKDGVKKLDKERLYRLEKIR